MRAHEQVLAWVEAELAAGRIGVGDRLPAERALAAQLGVSRPSVREAVRVLESMGVVRARTGSGPEAGAVVVGGPATGIGDSLGAALRLHTATSRLPVADVVATRVLLETWAVDAAARRRDDGGERAEALARAAALLDAMDDDGADAAAFIALDAQFHVALAACAGNAVVEAVMTSLREAVQSYVTAGVATLPDWAATAARLRAEHRGVLDAVAAGRAHEASALVRAHIEGFAAEAGLRP
ncbi:FadR/GntR family transcriptional regulator [Quadrisphaera sp. KR29]|uniref:FadR/GntR family transcriptional regulator n=1 Tax=Quadrisphaera sp. KR29 TaxID=3461391 RepID=UPI004043BA8E